ncbi:torso-like protein [Cylas formicarius]|uniref:torso-like protein n=1 Tax=Cylas formicarius TaxID=197179 RepID=UPI0029587261|nr:torso-like protein [Cylas formicarius]XP_060531294.1 torso-like protein [Cylas formicarius]
MWCGAQQRQQHQTLMLLTAMLSLFYWFGEDVVYGATSDESQLKVGRSIDIFTRYGYLSLSMKVVPRNDSEWIFREPTINVFTDVDRYSSVSARTPKKQKKVFDGDFHMEFCDNLQQLVQAYFRDFNFERLEKPWRAFTSSWSTETLARNLGVNSTYLAKDHCYVLVRLSRFRDSVELTKTPRDLGLIEDVQQEIENIRFGDVASVFTFIKKYGSHYIQSYITGNSLYQVFVFNKTRYLQIKDRLKNQGISHIGEGELNQYFSPWQAVHMGAIKVASGNKTVELWASSKLRHNYYIFTYPSLLKSKGDPRLLGKLNSLLGNEAILEIEMKTLAPVFKNPLKRKWFEEVLDNSLKLWESNL